jgi:hypothetical protein
MKDLFVELASEARRFCLQPFAGGCRDICDRIGFLYGAGCRSRYGKGMLQQRNETQIRTQKLSSEAIEKIRQVAAAEGQSLEIENPMDKLESFFVRIISKARQEKQRTSGAEMGTGILGFLAEKPVLRENVLDKLVSVQLQDGTRAGEAAVSSVETTEPVAAPAFEGQSSQELLRGLVNKSDTAPAQTLRLQDIGHGKRKIPQVKKSILDELINRRAAVNADDPLKTEDKTMLAWGLHKTRWPGCDEDCVVIILLLLILAADYGQDYGWRRDAVGKLQTFTTIVRLISFLL